MNTILMGYLNQIIIDINDLVSLLIGLIPSKDLRILKGNEQILDLQHVKFDNEDPSGIIIEGSIIRGTLDQKSINYGNITLCLYIDNIVKIEFNNEYVTIQLKE